MKKFLIFSLVSLALCFTFFACEDDADVTKPIIELDEPEDGDTLQIGKEVHFECDFSDDIMLGSYMVEIHSNFDGHAHKTPAYLTSAHNTPACSAPARIAQTTEPLFYKQSYDLSGFRNTHIHHHDIVIPENTTPGNYHLMVYCTDAAGNQSLVARDIILSNDAPEHNHD